MSAYSFKNGSDRIRIDPLPVRTQLKYRRECIIGRKQNESHAILIQHGIPLWLHIRHLRVCFEKLLAVKIAPAVHEHLRAAGKSVDQIATPLVLRENARPEVVLFE